MSVGRGHYKAFEFLGAGMYGYGQSTAHRTQRTVEPEFAYEHVAFQTLLAHCAFGRKNSYGKRQIVAGTFLADVGRGEIYCNLVGGTGVAGVLKCGSYAVITLAHGAVGQTDKAELGAFRNVYLGFYCSHVEAVDGSGEEFYKHEAIAFS